MLLKRKRLKMIKNKNKNKLLLNLEKDELHLFCSYFFCLEEVHLPIFIFLYIYYLRNVPTARVVLILLVFFFFKETNNDIL